MKKFPKMENNSKNKDSKRTRSKMKIQVTTKMKIFKDQKVWSNKIWISEINNKEIKMKILVTKIFRAIKMKTQIHKKMMKKRDLIWMVVTKSSKMYLMILETLLNILKKRKSQSSNNSKNLKNPSKITKRLLINKKRKNSSQKAAKVSAIKKDELF